MKFSIEKIINVAESGDIATEVLSFVGNYYNEKAQLRNNIVAFFRAWAGEDAFNEIKVFTARDDGNHIVACVMALIVKNPLFIDKPCVFRFVDLHQNILEFQNYIDTVLESV